MCERRFQLFDVRRVFKAAICQGPRSVLLRQTAMLVFFSGATRAHIVSSNFFHEASKSLVGLMYGRGVESCGATLVARTAFD